MADEDFRHDMIIATDDGSIYHIPRDQWEKDEYKVPAKTYKSDGWKLVRELLQCGSNLAVGPPVLPGDKPEPMGTCYIVTLAGFTRSHIFHLKKSGKAAKKPSK